MNNSSYDVGMVGVAYRYIVAIWISKRTMSLICAKITSIQLRPLTTKLKLLMTFYD